MAACFKDLKDEESCVRRTEKLSARFFATLNNNHNSANHDCLPWKWTVNHKQLIHLLSTGLFRVFSKLEIYANCVWNHEKFGGKIINSFFQKKYQSRQCEEQVLERGYPESLLGFPCHVLSRDLRQTRLKA